MENQWRTNLEVLEWIIEHEGKSQHLFLDEAQKYFGSFSGGKKKLSILILKLKEVNKKRKRNTHKALLRNTSLAPKGALTHSLQPGTVRNGAPTAKFSSPFQT